ncbi:MAG TPA: cyclic nucleotide-binding domain-containing protein [Thermoanaerobaculia bacterium]|nr:cyclic nucleotide-binding domain-containing protein [Thermoanaerobaculia bacterium]
MKAKSAGPVRVKKGQFIVTEGDAGTEMYLIEEGSVEILKKGPGGEQRVVRVLGPGDFFGELAILAEMPRNSSARAVTDCGLLAIDDATFDQMLRSYPDVAVRMLKTLARRLHESDAANSANPRPSESDGAPRENRPKADEAPSAPARASRAAAALRLEGPEPSEAGGARLVHKASGAVLPLSGKEEYLVGRFDADAGVRPDVDLNPIDSSRSISRRQARILVENGAFFVLEPKATANGTFVNRKRIATGAKVGLKSGDELRFGSVTLTFETS